MRRFCIRCTGILLSVLIAVPVIAQDDIRLLRDRESDQRPALAVLGTAHFANPGRDLINREVEDVLSDRRQAEMLRLVEQLASFQPTHVAVEWPGDSREELDSRYRDFREGQYQLGRSEVDQIGLRLADMLDLERVYAVDWNGDPPGGFDEDYDWYSYAQSQGEDALLAAISDPEGASESHVPLEEQTIATWLGQLNEPERLAASHRMYFDIAMIGDEERQPGANWVGHWYARNLRIFRNLVALTDRPEDRILVIYGRGHAYLLRQFAVESGAFELVDLEEILDQ